MTTNYARGANFERKTRDYCMSKDVGAVYVIRAAGSHTIADLVVLFRDKPPWLVQCKRDGRLSDEDTELLVSLANEAQATPILAYQGKRGFPVQLRELGGS